MSKTLLSNGAFVGTLLLVALVVVGHFLIPGITSAFSVKAMLVLAAFLGIATIGQTLVALVGGLDLAIPFVIGSANIFTLWLVSQGWPDFLAIVTVLALGALIGALNGVLSLRLQGQALIISLAVGFATVGATQIRTTIGSAFGGNVNAPVPDWLLQFSSPQGTVFGLGIPPVVLLWAFLGLLTVQLIRLTTAGRSLYALGGNRSAAKYVLVSEARTWCGAYTISGFTAALTGVALLGFTGGGFVGVGDPYLFTSVAAVVVGGTSLLGGRGGYGHTVVGVLVLIVLGTLLVGVGLSTAGQQVVLGLLIVPMVALYARLPHPSMTV